MTDRRTVLCPSATCEDGAVLLGRVVERKVAFASRPVRLNTAIASELRARGDPERMFQFAAPCAKSGCGQWAQGRCGVVDMILDASQPGPKPASLPACLIRGECRWFIQRGPHACALCQYVVTDNTEIATHPAV